MKNSLIFVERTLEICWQRIEATCSNDARSLGFFRMFWGAYILLFYAPYSAWVSQVPQSFSKPPVLSVAFLFSGFPPYWLMLTTDLVRIWLLVLITIGTRTRICTIVLCLLTFISTNFVYSFGKIDHDILLWAVALCLAFTDWGVCYALVPDPWINPKVAARASATAGVLIAFEMFSAGFEKALHWINFNLSTGGFLSWFYPLYYSLGRTFLLAPVVVKLPPQLFKIADFTAVGFELSAFFFLLAGRTAWRVWLLLAAIFHITNALLLNIPFYIHVPVYLSFVALARFSGRPEIAGGATRALSWRIPLVVSAILLGVAHTAQRLMGEGFQFLFVAQSADLSPFMIYCPLALLGFCAVVIAIDLATQVYDTRTQRAR